MRFDTLWAFEGLFTVQSYLRVWGSKRENLATSLPKFREFWDPIRISSLGWVNLSINHLATPSFVVSNESLKYLFQMLIVATVIF